MRTVTLIVAAVSSLSLAAPSLAQQRGWRGLQSAPAAPVTAAPRPATPGVNVGASQRTGGWRSRPERPGNWQRPGRPGNWQRPGRPDNWQRPVRRWGEKIQGRWHAGWRAPGGWGAYRRPVRGWILPNYWIGSGFWINDWSNWGLSRPPYGYNWIRYYDDAVLVDRGGRVWDSVSGVEWDRDDYGYDDYGYDERDYADDRDDYGAGYDAPDYDDRDYGDSYYEERDRALPPPPRGHAETLRCVAHCHVQHSGPGTTTTTVVIQSAPVTTTTTVTEEIINYGGRKTVRRVPTKTLYRAPARGKTRTCCR